LVEDEEFTDLCFMFAAYVNEQHPFVDKLLREALDRGAVDSFTGYQSGDAGEVYRQVFAVWDALSARDVRYSDITATAAESESVYCQHVRLLDETINNNQANCVDGSVLFASVLRKVGIEAYLVMVPRHCYLAFALDEKGEKIVALETTLMQSAAPEKFAKIDGLAELLDEKVAQRRIVRRLLSRDRDGDGRPHEERRQICSRRRSRLSAHVGDEGSTDGDSSYWVQVQCGIRIGVIGQVKILQHGTQSTHCRPIPSRIACASGGG